MVPNDIIAGDTIEFSVNTDFRDGFTGEFRLTGPRGPDASSFDYTITDGEVEIDATVSATYIPGLYDWVIIETDGTKIFTKDSGELKVKLRSDLNVLQPKSTNRVILEAIQAVMTKTATYETQSYSIKGRSLSRHTLSELQELYKHYKRLVEQEEGNTSYGPRLISPLFVRR